LGETHAVHVVNHGCDENCVASQLPAMLLRYSLQNSKQIFKKIIEMKLYGMSSELIYMLSKYPETITLLALGITEQLNTGIWFKGTVRPDWICMRVVPLESPLKGHQPLYVFDFLISVLNI
jgi:hypothetical protein